MLPPVMLYWQLKFKLRNFILFPPVKLFSAVFYAQNRVCFFRIGCSKSRYMFKISIGCSMPEKGVLNQDRVFYIRIDVLNQDMVFYTRIGCSKSG